MKSIKVMLTLALLVAASSVNAQAADDWQKLNQLRKGQKIEVVDMNLKKVTGEFTDLSEAAITVRTGKDSVNVLREEVLRVSLREKSKRLRNAAIGAAIGAAVGLITGALIDKSFDSQGEHISKPSLRRWGRERARASARPSPASKPFTARLPARSLRRAAGWTPPRSQFRLQACAGQCKTLGDAQLLRPLCVRDRETSRPARH